MARCRSWILTLLLLVAPHVIHGIALSVGRASQRTSKVDHAISVLSEQTSGTGAAATQVLDAAGEPSRHVGTLKIQVGSFLAAVQAA